MRHHPKGAQPPLEEQNDLILLYASMFLTLRFPGKKEGSESHRIGCESSEISGHNAPGLADALRRGLCGRLRLRLWLQRARSGAGGGNGFSSGIGRGGGRGAAAVDEYSPGVFAHFEKEGRVVALRCGCCSSSPFAAPARRRAENVTISRRFLGCCGSLAAPFRRRRRLEGLRGGPLPPAR